MGNFHSQPHLAERRPNKRANAKVLGGRLFVPFSFSFFSCEKPKGEGGLCSAHHTCLGSARSASSSSWTSCSAGPSSRLPSCICGRSARRMSRVLEACGSGFAAPCAARAARPCRARPVAQPAHQPRRAHRGLPRRYLGPNPRWKPFAGMLGKRAAAWCYKRTGRAVATALPANPALADPGPQPAHAPGCPGR